MGGRGAMTTAPISLQDLQRRLYAKAKAEKDWRFWGLYVDVSKLGELRRAYAMAQENDGAPGIDGGTVEAIAAGRGGPVLGQLPGHPVSRPDRPLRDRRAEATN